MNQVNKQIKTWWVTGGGGWWDVVGCEGYFQVNFEIVQS